MAKVSFYLFEKSPERQVQSTCRLCRKILRQHQQIWLHCPDPNMQQELDDLLWDFDATSFIPHGIDQPNAPVCISADLPKTAEWIIFNFNSSAIAQPDNFGHIIEIIENTEHAKQLGREKFKSYRQLGIAPQPFKL